MKPKHHKTLFTFFKNLSYFSFLLLIVPSTLMSQDLIERTKRDLPYEDVNAAENRLYQSTQSAKFNGGSTFQAIDLFSVSSSPITQAESNLLPLDKVVFLDLEEAVLSKILASKVDFLSLSIPVERDKYIELELVRKNLLHPDFISKSSTGEFSTSEGIFYRGVVKGEPNSIASISLYSDKIRGLISDTNGNYEIGKMNGKNSYALFNDQSLTTTPFFNCDVEDEYLETISTSIENQIDQAQFSSDSVDIYIECDFDMYTKFGSSKPAVETFVTGLMNEIATIFENESIPVRVSEILVWESTDPYASVSANTTSLLNAFEAERTAYNGAFAMLFSTRAQAGGRAGVDRFCNNEAHGITLLTETSYQPYPTYSNWVNVTAHEIGHLFGSPHTHNCSWGPTSDKAIDNCVATEGGCGLVTDPTPTAEKGTIMSYCHVVSGGGFSLSKGFGTEPGNLIRDRYQNAVCQTTCSHLPAPLTALPGPSCTPQTNTTYINGGYAGLMSIIIGDNKTSSSYTANDEAFFGGGGFIDFTDRCYKAFVLEEGGTYNVSLTTWFNNHSVKAWIDYNNNNQFDEPAELIFTIGTSNRTNSLTSGTGSFTVAASPTLDTYLKLRFIGDLGTVSGPCHNPTYGQCEDYAVYIKSAPVTCTNPTPSLGTITNPSTCGGTNGSIQLTGLTASTAYTLNYKKDNVAATAVNFTSNGSGQYTLANLGEGAYSEINVTIATCTSTNLSTTLLDPTGSTAAVISGTTVTCGESTNLSVAITGGTGDYTVVYSDGSSNTTVNNYASGSNIAVTPTSTTTYTLVSVTDDNGCLGTGNSGSAVVTVHEGSTAAVISGTTSTCGESTNLSVAITGGTGNYSVVYNDGSSNTTVNNYASGSNIAVTPTSTTTYTLVSVTDDNGCLGTGNSGSAIVTVHEGSTTATMSGTATITSGNSTPISVVISGGSSPYTLVYNDGSSDISLPGYTSGTAISVSPTSNTTYTIISVTDNNGCVGTGNTGSAIITVETSTSTCANGMLEVPASNNNETYSCDSVSSDMTIAAGDVVVYEACDEIILKTGFHAEATSAFTARIVGSCAPFQAPAVARNSISNADEQTNLSLAPNPAVDFLTVDYQLGEVSTASIGLYDMTGKRLMDIVPIQAQAKGKYQQQFSLGHLQAGMYFVLLQTETEQISKKLILVR